VDNTTHQLVTRLKRLAFRDVETLVVGCLATLQLEDSLAVAHHARRSASELGDVARATESIDDFVEWVGCAKEVEGGFVVKGWSLRSS
jgi:hypothetical protein